MKENIMRVKISPELTAEEEKMAEKLAAMPDSEINFDDIPEIAADAKFTRFYPDGVVAPLLNRNRK